MTPAEKRRRRNPFITRYVPGIGDVQAAGAEDRIGMVPGFTYTQCMFALRLPGLQKTVRNALQRRARQIDRSREKRKSKP